MLYTSRESILKIMNLNKFIFWCLLISPALQLVGEPIEFVIVIPSYNNEKWCAYNIESIAIQTYPYWSIYYINDGSEDTTGEKVEGLVKSLGIEDRCKIVNNPTRKLALANVYAAIHEIEPTKVVVLCDGDDWLAKDNVLEKLAQVYANKDIWMTYGNYQTWPQPTRSCCAPFPEKIRKKGSFRAYNWVSSHLKTFYAKLFQLIKKESLIEQEDEFFSATWDLAIMFPMLEMAANGHYQFIEEILYIYNTDNPINVFKVNLPLQDRLDRYIRTLPVYQPLQSLY